MADLKQWKEQLERNSDLEIQKKTMPSHTKIVAEGDSWFNYIVQKDVINFLRKLGYQVKNRAVPGDLLENMVLGSRFRIKKGKVKNAGDKNMQRTLISVIKTKPRFVLLSGGGNGIVGDEMGTLINHKNSGLDPVRHDMVDYLIDQVDKNLIRNFCEKIWAIDPEIDILMDGYDYAVPTGKKVLKVGGPWILPTMGRKAYENRNEQEEIIKILVDQFNEMLISLEKEYKDRPSGKFHHVNLRGKFPNDNQWHNEIHLKSEGFEVVAGLYDQKMKAILGKQTR